MGSNRERSEKLAIALGLGWPRYNDAVVTIERAIDAACADLFAQNERLRQVLAYEARVVEAHHEGYKSPPKSRIKFMIMQSKRMRQEALTPGGGSYAGANIRAAFDEIVDESEGK